MIIIDVLDYILQFLLPKLMIGDLGATLERPWADVGAPLGASGTGTLGSNMAAASIGRANGRSP